MSEYKVIHGGVVRMNDKDCGFTGMTNRAIVMRFNKLEAENAELKATLSVIREKISDATYHGKASFSACLSYIDVLAKDMSDNNLLKH